MGVDDAVHDVDAHGHHHEHQVVVPVGGHAEAKAQIGLGDAGQTRRAAGDWPQCNGQP